MVSISDPFRMQHFCHPETGKKFGWQGVIPLFAFGEKSVFPMNFYPGVPQIRIAACFFDCRGKEF